MLDGHFWESTWPTCSKYQVLLGFVLLQIYATTSRAGTAYPPETPALSGVHVVRSIGLQIIIYPFILYCL